MREALMRAQRSPTLAAPPDDRRGSQQAQAHCIHRCLNGAWTWACPVHIMGCLTSLNSGAGPAAAPRSPPRGHLPTTPHPRLTSSTLGQHSMPPNDYILKSRTANYCILATFSRMPNPPDHFTLNVFVLRFLFI